LFWFLAATPVFTLVGAQISAFFYFEPIPITEFNFLVDGMFMILPSDFKIQTPDGAILLEAKKTEYHP